MMWTRATEARLRTTAVARTLMRRRFLVQLAIDVAMWWLALLFATVLRHDFALGELDWSGLAVMLPVSATAQVFGGALSGVYAGRWRFGSFDEVAGLARATSMATVVVFGADLVLGQPRPVPISATVAGGIIALVLQGGVRYLFRLVLEARRRPQGDGLTRLVVFGAGEGAQQVITAMLRDPDSPYLPVALLDDDPAKRNLRLSGVRVLGTREALPGVVAETGADAVLIAIPSAGHSLITEITDIAESIGVSVKVVPAVRDLFNDSVGLSDIRDVTDADLLGRHVIETDLASIAGYLTGKRVLVTGAGGSIGSELCRQIWRYAPSELLMLDRDESALHAVQLSIEGRALLDTPNLILADIRDGARLAEIFAGARPEVVFHAAALKHLPLLELHPGEAVQTNVWGTLNVLHAAATAGVERFVNISTDKAADPTSVLGYTKRITERLTAWFGHEHDGCYLSVRFGNVLGSRGSVLTAFHAQIAAGGPVTVTDPEVTRYFMTVQEAVELVIQAAAIGRRAEALVLDMGDPVRIADVAHRLVSNAPRRVNVVFTGLRPGEKLHESLWAADEIDERPVHPLISHVRVPRLSPSTVLDLDPWDERDILLKDLVDRSVTVGVDR